MSEPEAYGLDDLLEQFGQRWSVTPRQYADGEKLAAEPRPRERPFIPIVRDTPLEMREALLAEDLASHRHQA